MDVNSQRLDSIQNLYCTKQLLDWREKEEQDYDPFINAQDLDDDLYKIFNIARDKSAENKFVVRYYYWAGQPERASKIELIVVKVGNGYEIERVLTP